MLKSIFLYVFIICVIPFSSSCKKSTNEEVLSEKILLTQNSDFFNIPVDCPAIILRISEILKQQDHNSPFANDMAKNFGLPAWKNCSFLTASVNRNGREAFGNDADTTVLIPLIIQNTAYVNSFIACAESGDSLSFKLYRGNEYASYGYQNNGNAPSANSIAKTMMAMEYNIFGHESFFIKDKSLSIYKQMPQRGFSYYKIRPKQATPGNGRLLVPIPIEECWEEAWFFEDEDGNVSQESSWVEVCQTTYTWIEIGLGNTGGGSTGNNADWVNIGPCGNLPCLGGGGAG
jgi:hypothetical protein